MPHTRATECTNGFPPGSFVMVRPDATMWGDPTAGESTFAAAFGVVLDRDPQPGYDVWVDVEGRGRRQFKTVELALVTLPEA